MKNSQMLRAGIARIKQHGWIQGAFGSPDQGFCLRGAFREEWTESIPDHITIESQKVTEGLRTDYFRTAWALNDFITEQSDGRFVQITVWNDHPYRTKEQVLTFMDETATAWEAQGL